MMRAILYVIALVLLGGCAPRPASPPPPRLRGVALDAQVEKLMQAAKVPGLALAVIENGRVVYLRAYGLRDAERGLPLTPDTVMYAASLTKAAFAYATMSLVDENRLALDRSIADDLPKPLPAYPKYADLAGDERWHALTPGILLSHRSGFANFRFLQPGRPDDPNGKLTIYFPPGERYAYSGEGINLLQFVLEHGQGIDVDALMRRRLFERYGMNRTSMTWRDDFADNFAIGYDQTGQPLGHKHRSSARAAGSMDTTARDYARLLAAMVRGDGLSRSAYAQWLTPRIAIRSVQQFPTIGLPDTRDNEGIDLAYALGVGVFRSPQGPAWFKGGHDDGTNNLALCLRARRDCLLILSNSSNAEGIFEYLIEAALGPTCFPWFWEGYIPYDHREWRGRLDLPHPPCTPLPEPP